MRIGVRPGRVTWSSVTRGAEPAREPAAGAHVRLARFADRRADRGCARACAAARARGSAASRSRVEEVLAEPGACRRPQRDSISPAPTMTKSYGASRCSSGDLLGRIAAPHAHRRVRAGPPRPRARPAPRAARPGGARRRRRRGPSTTPSSASTSGRASSSAGARPAPSSQTSSRGVGCRRMCHASRTTHGFSRGGSECAEHGDVEQDVLLAERQRRHDLAHARRATGRRTRVRRTAPEKVSSTISPAPERRDARARLLRARAPPARAG